MTTTQTLHDMTAADVMTDHPVRIQDDMLVEEAADLLASFQISGAPVVDSSDRCVGVLSTTDLVRAAKQDSPRVIVAYDPFYRVEEHTSFPDDPVRNWMTKDLVTVRPDQTIASIARTMLDAGIHRVIVIDDQHRPQGIIATTDILAAVVRTSQES